MLIINIYSNINKMILWFTVLNVNGQQRLKKWYINATEETKEQTHYNVQKKISERSSLSLPNYFDYEGNVILYRKYQKLFFCICIEKEDNILSYMEVIHLYVTVLHSYFNPVSELDFVYNFYKCYLILDEIISGGTIMETSKIAILNHIRRMDK
eukprot:TRINITY_DN3335_c0_g4_i1.p1 TRINITY_DN3335_c0_g4~~TRINITY_DN3335_c0_g4_i1.p1  ORF type:complete len:154 (+),score=14.21 TRINITY_DN3335_c0_g4_i1:280-741(+)